MCVSKRHEGWATFWLTAGSLLPVAGWLVGLRLAWTSSLWTLRQKLAVTLMLPGGLTGAIWCALTLAGATSYTCSSGSFSQTAGLGGPALSTTVIPQTCTSPAVPTWVALALAFSAFALALGVPIVNWFSISGRGDRRRTVTSTPVVVT
jgi:hypothetical protein